MDTAAIANKATRIELRNFRTPQMRAFHVTWLAFFLAFFAWFAMAPLTPTVRDEFDLSKAQISNIVIASVAITVVARLAIGWACDRIGPRRAYALLLTIGALPVMGIGLAQSYETFLLARLAIGVIGASFVITQYHTSVMFAPNVVGTANAATAGWGNLGGGVALLVMPLLFTAITLLGVSEALGWRLAMLVPGGALFVMGLVYYRFTQDAPDGDFRDLRRARAAAARDGAGRGAFWAAARDPRVWLLFVVYGACFGMELTINNVAATYFHDDFGLSLVAAGAIASLSGWMNLFARALGGILGDRAGIRWGLRGRTWFLGGVLLAEGVALIVFSQMAALALAIPAMIVFSVFGQVSNGATFAVVPFVNRRALGPVAGIVGAGGNVGAVAAGFLFRFDSLSNQNALFILGVAVVAIAPLAFLIRFSRQTEATEEHAIASALAERQSLAAAYDSAGRRLLPAGASGD